MTTGWYAICSFFASCRHMFDVLSSMPRDLWLFLTSPTRLALCEAVFSYLRLCDSHILCCLLCWFSSRVPRYPGFASWPWHYYTGYYTALKETVFRLQRPEELPASFELGVHIQGRRKNHRSEARQLPPGAWPATAAAVGVPAPSLDGDCASACSVRHLRRRRP